MSKLEESTAIDRISELPDEILCHILSFLSTKLAFTTIVLSKRWTPLCYSLTVLRFNFNYETVKNHNSFNHLCRFIDILMLSPRVSNQPIKTFSLKCRSLYHSFNSPSNVSAWVEVAAKLRHVEKFDLILNYSITLKLNPIILTSRTLVILKLEQLQIQSDNLCVDLPSLKTLHFKYVSFKNKNDFMKLLNACPVLQDLHTSCNYYDENKEAKEFKSLSLSKLVRAIISSIDVPFTAIYNVEFLSIYIGQTFKSIPVFQNLIHIKLWFYNFFRGWDGIVELLLNCPKLQILFIKKGIELSLSKDLEFPISAIECVSSHLGPCTIVNFKGSLQDFQFATYILQNARLLEVMKINVSASSSEGMQKHEIIEKLSTCPRMSSGCKLSF